MEPLYKKSKSPNCEMDSSESIDKFRSKCDTMDIDFRTIDSSDSPIKSDNVTPTPFEDISSSTDVALSAEETSTSLTIPSKGEDVSNLYSTESSTPNINSEMNAEAKGDMVVMQPEKGMQLDITKPQYSDRVNSTEETPIKMDPKVEAILTSISKFTDENNCAKFDSAICKMEENYVPSPSLTALTKTLEKLKEENEAILNKKTKPLMDISSSIKAELADVRKDIAEDYKQTSNQSFDYLCSEVANLATAMQHEEANHMDKDGKLVKRMRSIENKIVDPTALGENLGVKIADLGNACWTVSL